MATTPQEGKSVYERINDEQVMMPLTRAMQILESAMIGYQPDPAKQVQAIGGAIRAIREAMQGSHQLKIISAENKSERVRKKRRKARTDDTKETTNE